jgi:single-strand DNA-binding protein
MSEIITATGVVATPPEFRTVGSGLSRLTFRLASTQRKFNRAEGTWQNGDTNWYTVVAFRRLADNARESIAKGERIVVSGRLRVNAWEREGARGVQVEILADALGHDLMFGTSRFARSVTAVPALAAVPERDDTHTPAVDSDGWAVPGGGSAGDDDGDEDEPPEAARAELVDAYAVGETPF